jgi:hypothetical protein
VSGYVDEHGTPIKVGCRVAADTQHDIPGGVVVRLTEPDADYNDATGRAEAYGPDVFVLYDDGVEDHWRLHYDIRYDAYVCDDITIEQEGQHGS